MVRINRKELETAINKLKTLKPVQTYLKLKSSLSKLETTSEEEFDEDSAEDSIDPLFTKMGKLDSAFDALLKESAEEGKPVDSSKIKEYNTKKIALMKEVVSSLGGTLVSGKGGVEENPDEDDGIPIHVLELKTKGISAEAGGWLSDWWSEASNDTDELSYDQNSKNISLVHNYGR